jgi:hypothetical protein
LAFEPDAAPVTLRKAAVVSTVIYGVKTLRRRLSRREDNDMKKHWFTPAGLHTASSELPVEGELPSLDGATGWLNSPPLTAAGLRGKVVLVNFWTYTCINWLRQLPNFASPGGVRPGKPHVYSAPGELIRNHWALSGDWTMEEGAIRLNTANGRVAYRFHARDLNLVMGPAAQRASIRFQVLLDGQPPGAAHGADVDGQGQGTVTEQRLYQLIRQPERITDRTFEITFPDPGVEAYSFTFG